MAHHGNLLAREHLDHLHAARRKHGVSSQCQCSECTFENVLFSWIVGYGERCSQKQMIVGFPHDLNIVCAAEHHVDTRGASGCRFGGGVGRHLGELLFSLGGKQVSYGEIARSRLRAPRIDVRHWPHAPLVRLKMHTIINCA